MWTILIGLVDLFARAGAVADVVVGGVETLDRELETRRGVLPGLRPGGIVWSRVSNDSSKAIDSEPYEVSASAFLRTWYCKARESNTVDW